tara:strand:- start:481 stop:732 length:252 start_codon:yes stop_codon:yes gene_type:complete
MTIVCPIECVKDEADFLQKHSTFVLTTIGSVSALLGVVMSYCLKSRCTNIRTPCLSCDRVPLNPDDIAISPTPIEVKEVTILK